MVGEHINNTALDELKSIMGDDFGLLIETFTKDSESRIEALGVAIDNQNSELLRTTAHSFKGSSSNVGAPALADYCYQLEKMARAENLVNSAGVLNRVKEEFDRVRQVLESMV